MTTLVNGPPRYIVITPVRDEEAYLKSTMDSMFAQTIRPIEWVIVNDGSTDGTAQILDRYASQHSWVRAVHRENRGFRKSGGGVMEAFNAGYAALEHSNWQFLVKLDGDLAFEPGYFQSCFRHFEQDPQLGIGGGTICHVQNGLNQAESVPHFHVRGATKIYRRECWDQIGGLWPAPGWDTIDEVKANMLGWRTQSFPELELVHHRLTGSADGRWGGLVKNGRANYISGYHPVFMLAKCLRRLGRRPDFLGSLALGYGFVTGYLKRIPQVNDPQLITYIRHQQMNRLRGGETIWQ